MAAIEKVCECSSDDCAYHGGYMWNYKHNHLQINPECRDKYFGLKAKIFIINPNYLSSDDYYAYSRWGRISYGRLDRKDDIYFDGVLYNEEQYKMVRSPYKRYFLTPVKKVFKHEVMVIVGNEVFYNDTWDMRKFKLNMTKMFGKGNVEYKQLSKKYCAKFKDTYSAFKKIEKSLN